MEAVIGETDMAVFMQQHAMLSAARALGTTHVAPDCQTIAHFLKQEFDKSYGSGWQCVVGTNFGSFVTHSHGHFIYFFVGKLAILLFKASLPCYHIDD